MTCRTPALRLIPALILLLAPAPSLRAEVGFRVEPAQVPVSLFYGGAEVTLRAEVPAGEQVAVRVSGHRGPLALKKKGKVMGVLWMNVDDVELDDVPDVYMLATSAPLASLAPAGELDRLGLGYHALAGRIGGEADLFPELRKLKEAEGLYSVSESSVALEPAAGGAATAQLSASLQLPARVPVGDYTVDLIGFRGARGEVLGSADLHLEEVGVASKLRALAMEHGVLYGIAAVLVAIVAGLITGLIFGGGDGKGH